MSADIRSRARELLEEYKGRVGNQKFDHVFKDWGGALLNSELPRGAGPGTSCTYPCHWMLWRLGCAEANLVNRFDAATTWRSGRVHYQVERGVSRIANHPQFRTVYTEECTDTPATGDILFIKTNPQLRSGEGEHVLIFLEESASSSSLPSSLPGGRTPVALWLFAEAGGVELQVKYRLVMRGPTPYNTHPRAYLLGRDQTGADAKSIVGWLPLDRLAFAPGCEPIPKNLDPLWGGQGLPSFSLGDKALLLGEWEANDPNYGDIHYIFCKGGQIVVTGANGRLPLLWEGAWMFTGTAVVITWLPDGAKEYWDYPLKPVGQTARYRTDGGQNAALSARKSLTWSSIWARAGAGIYG